MPASPPPTMTTLRFISGRDFVFAHTVFGDVVENV
jgi:hypothetical protein